MRILTVIMLLAVAAIGFWLMKSKLSKAIDKNDSGFSPELVDRINRASAEREQIRRQDPQFFAAVSKAMFEHDPMGINFETNTDEYDAEAGTVIPRLSACASAEDVVIVLHEEFQRWFDVTAGTREKFIDLAKDIWNLYKQRKPN
jgi:hypothetical protein